MPESSNVDKVRLSTRLRYRTVGDEGVLVHLENGRVLVVNEVGIHCVEALGQQPMTIAELAESVVQSFEVDTDQARADVEAFLDALRAERAIDSADPTDV
jgi:hypothetical protein